MGRQKHSPDVLVWVIFGLCLLPEISFGLDNSGWFGSSNLRGLAVHFGGFWPQLLQGPGFGFPGQQFTMFISHGFLHAGIVHFGVNMLALFPLARMVIGRNGGAGFAQIYLVSMVAGAGGFYLLSTGNQPMIGASGAIYGLFGAVLASQFADPSNGRNIRARIWRYLLIVVALNGLLWWSLGGGLAWQAHLAGGAAGWFIQILRNRE